MSYFVHHRYGASERELPFDKFPGLLDELDERTEDEEHTSASLVHESEWALGFSKGGYVTFEHVEGDGQPRHMIDIPRSKLLELMKTLALGDLPSLEREPWIAGY